MHTPCAVSAPPAAAAIASKGGPGRQVVCRALRVSAGAVRPPLIFVTNFIAARVVEGDLTGDALFQTEPQGATRTV